MVEAGDCDCTTPLESLMGLSPASLATTISANHAFSKTPEPFEPADRIKMAEITFSNYRKSIARELPQDFYAFATVTAESKIAPLTALDYEGFWIIDSRFKAILDLSMIYNSECYPIHIVLRSKRSRSTEMYGGGDVVSGKYWLWHFYDLLPIVDFDRTDADIGERDPANNRGSRPLKYIDKLRTLALTGAPYAHRDVFGLDLSLRGTNRNIFVSPAFRDRLFNAGLLYPDDNIALLPFVLEEERWLECERARSPISYRVFGTDILAPGDRQPPFLARAV
jgi:hypothetical protein